MHGGSFSKRNLQIDKLLFAKINSKIVHHQPLPLGSQIHRGITVVKIVSHQLNVHMYAQRFLIGEGGGRLQGSSRVSFPAVLHYGGKTARSTSSCIAIVSIF